MALAEALSLNCGSGVTSLSAWGCAGGDDGARAAAALLRGAACGPWHGCRLTELELCADGAVPDGVDGHESCVYPLAASSAARACSLLLPQLEIGPPRSPQLSAAMVQQRIAAATCVLQRHLMPPAKLRCQEPLTSAGGSLQHAIPYTTCQRAPLPASEQQRRSPITVPQMQRLAPISTAALSELGQAMRILGQPLQRLCLDYSWLGDDGLTAILPGLLGCRSLTHLSPYTHSTLPTHEQV